MKRFEDQDYAMRAGGAKSSLMSPPRPTGTSFDKVRMSSPLSADHVHRSSLFSGVRLKQTASQFVVQSPGIKDIIVNFSKAGAHWCDTRQNGKALGDIALAPGNISVIPPECDWSFDVAWSGGTAFTFYLDPQEFADVLGDELTQGRMPELRAIARDKNDILGRAARAYEAEFAKCDPFSAIAFDSIALAVCTELARTYTDLDSGEDAPVPRAEDRRMRTAKDFIMSSLDEPIGLRDIASSIGMSQYHFARLFKAIEGVTPYQYVREQRIRKAKRLLQTSELSIAQIAYECGFSSQQHFTTAFKGRFNIPPGQWRRIKGSLN